MEDDYSQLEIGEEVDVQERDVRSSLPQKAYSLDEEDFDDCQDLEDESDDADDDDEEVINIRSSGARNEQPENSSRGLQVPPKSPFTGLPGQLESTIDLRDSDDVPLLALSAKASTFLPPPPASAAPSGHSGGLALSHGSSQNSLKRRRDGSDIRPRHKSSSVRKRSFRPYGVPIPGPVRFYVPALYLVIV